MEDRRRNFFSNRFLKGVKREEKQCSCCGIVTSKKEKKTVAREKGIDCVQSDLFIE